MMSGSNECTWPEMKQRAHYLSWLAAAIGTAALIGLTFELLFVKMTGGDSGWEVVPLLYLCAIVPPYVYIWRRYGEASCGFLELEHALDEAVAHSADALTGRYATIADFISRIEAARGMARQLVRNEAKAWLQAHAEELTPDERDFVADHLGYLHRR
jgi:hypothetical protein